MAQGWAIPKREKGHTVTAVTSPTSRPRVTAPAVKPTASSAGDKGGVRKSTAVPMSLACTREEEELAKALFRIDIMIRPGPTNCENATPCTSGLAPRMATTKIII